jgi:hypothetical protein
MFKLTDSNGRDVYLTSANVARIDEAGTSSQWHGIRSFVRLVDGDVIECQEDAATVARLVGTSSPRATPEQVRIATVIADQIEAGTLFKAGIFSKRQLADAVRVLLP